MSPSLREKRREQRNEQILNAALDLFAEKGYHNTSVEEIANKALLTRAGLYKYYPDKASLVGALRSQKTTELANLISSSLKNTQSFEQKIEIIIREMLIFQNKHPGFFRVLFTASSLKELNKETSFDEFGNYLSKIIQDAVDAQEIKQLGSAEQMMILLVSLIFKNSIKRNIFGKEPPNTLEQDLELTKEIFLNGVLHYPKNS